MGVSALVHFDISSVILFKYTTEPHKGGIKRINANSFFRDG
jgi:hypothetical protein